MAADGQVIVNPVVDESRFIEFAHVTKWFHTANGPFTAVSDLCLQVAKGKTLCVVGPSGCGKTTILNLVAGFLMPSSGTVTVVGRRVSGPGPDRAVVFQRDSVFPWLTVRQNLEYGPKVRGRPRQEWVSRVEEYLEKVGLAEFADYYPKQLSGGMRKRVDIARAYVNQPEILLMDEPFGPLDVMTKETMQRDLLELSAKEPRSLLFITHDIEEAVFLGDEVLVMNGRSANVQKPFEVPFSKPRDLSLKLEPTFQAVRRQVDRLLRGWKEG